MIRVPTIGSLARNEDRRTVGEASRVLIVVKELVLTASGASES